MTKRIAFDVRVEAQLKVFRIFHVRKVPETAPLKVIRVNPGRDFTSGRYPRTE